MRLGTGPVMKRGIQQREEGFTTILNHYGNEQALQDGQEACVSPKGRTRGHGRSHQTHSGGLTLDTRAQEQTRDSSSPFGPAGHGLLHFLGSVCIHGPSNLKCFTDHISSCLQTLDQGPGCHQCPGYLGERR